MKTAFIIAFCLFPVTFTMSGEPRKSPAPYEIVLDGETIVFDNNAERISSQMLIRDLGVQKMVAPNLFYGLSVIWDDKEYQRNAKFGFSWNGPWEIIPKTAWRTGFSLSEFLVPAEVLTTGRHTIAVKDAFVESNTLTIFIEKAK